jgi:hypothetical protein
VRAHWLAGWGAGDDRAPPDGLRRGYGGRLRARPAAAPAIEARRCRLGTRLSAHAERACQLACPSTGHQPTHTTACARTTLKARCTPPPAPPHHPNPPARAGTVSGGGVTDCNYPRAERDAQSTCAQRIQELRNQYDYARPCTSCFGNGQNYQLVGRILNNFDSGSCGLTGCSGRSCAYSHAYECCVTYGNVQAGPASSRNDDKLKLTGGDSCGCTQSYKNPVTGAAISCTCYFNNQKSASSCPGARYGQASQRYYRDC